MLLLESLTHSMIFFFGSLIKKKKKKYFTREGS